VRVRITSESLGCKVEKKIIQPTIIRGLGGLLKLGGEDTYSYAAYPYTRLSDLLGEVVFFFFKSYLCVYALLITFCVVNFGDYTTLLFLTVYYFCIIISATPKI
jgi:hypothetical protein